MLVCPACMHNYKLCSGETNLDARATLIASRLIDEVPSHDGWIISIPAQAATCVITAIYHKIASLRHAFNIATTGAISR